MDLCRRWRCSSVLGAPGTSAAHSLVDDADRDHGQLPVLLLAYRAQRVEAFKFVGDFGAMSCSPTGAMGFTGCTQKMIDAAYEAREGGSAARFSQLIAEARAERLSTIDEDAAAEQARVEMIEREYMERLEKERESEVAETPLPKPSASDD